MKIAGDSPALLVLHTEHLSAKLARGRFRLLQLCGALVDAALELLAERAELFRLCGEFTVCGFNLIARASDGFGGQDDEHAAAKVRKSLGKLFETRNYEEV